MFLAYKLQHGVNFVARLFKKDYCFTSIKLATLISL